MALSCPRCEQEPARNATPGSRCAGCGAELVIDLAHQSRGGAAGGLELDPAWEQERAARTVDTPVKRRRPPRLIAGTIVAVLLIGLVAFGIVVLVKRGHPRSPASLPGVSIYIRAVGAVEVMIDGHVAGKTPLVFTSRKTTKPILIEARTLGFAKQVVPDHDQDVYLSSE